MRNYLFLSLLVTLFASCTFTRLEKDSPINVMSFNIRYDNPDDSLNNWQYRKGRVGDAILFYNVDILGAQEVLHNQLLDLQHVLTDYNVLGVGREDGREKGEYSAIWYKKSRFDLLDTGYFWLSETPEVAGSKGWDGACERIATWAVLKDKKSDKDVFVINTHLDHVGKIARRDGVRLILDRIHTLSAGRPVILTGDFNSSPESDVVKSILADSVDNLENSSSIAKYSYGPHWSFHNFGRIPYNERIMIDYIFVSKGVKVERFGVLAEENNGEFLSDHAPVLSTVVLP